MKHFGAMQWSGGIPTSSGDVCFSREGAQITLMKDGTSTVVTMREGESVSAEVGDIRLQLTKAYDGNHGFTAEEAA